MYIKTKSLTCEIDAYTLINHIRELLIQVMIHRLIN